MASNQLKLNNDKTQIICLGTRLQLSKAVIHRLTPANATVQFSDVVRDLGVQLDSQLTILLHSADPASIAEVSRAVTGDRGRYTRLLEVVSTTATEPGLVLAAVCCTNCK